MFVTGMIVVTLMFLGAGIGVSWVASGYDAFVRSNGASDVQFFD